MGCYSFTQTYDKKKMTPIIYYVVLKKKIGPQVLYPHILVVVDPHGCFVEDPNFAFILQDIQQNLHMGEVLSMSDLNMIRKVFLQTIVKQALGMYPLLL